MSALDLTELDEWLTELAALPGIASATRQPERVQTPGVLCQVLGFRAPTLSSTRWHIDVRLVLVVGDNDVVRATDKLVALVNTTRGFLGDPPGDWTARTFRSSTGPDLPALGYEHTLIIEETP